MPRFRRTPAGWVFALAAAAGGCAPNPAPPDPAPAGGECEHCREPAKPATAAPPDADGHLRTAWLEPAARGAEPLPDLRVTDQDGRSLDLSELGGRPLALTFLYTRCTNPNRCPRVATRMGELQKLVEADGLGSRVNLAIMTYDPDYDTPAVLGQYGLDRGLRFTPGVRMLRPDPGRKDDFFDRLRVTVNYNADGVNLHGLQLFLFDGRGRFVRRYQSVVWDNAEVLVDLKRLAGEDPQPTGATP